MPIELPSFKVDEVQAKLIKVKQEMSHLYDKQRDLENLLRFKRGEMVFLSSTRVGKVLSVSDGSYANVKLIATASKSSVKTEYSSVVNLTRVNTQSINRMTKNNSIKVRQAKCDIKSLNQTIRELNAFNKKLTRMK